MAIDGIKIIDGDIAHDTYWGFMDLYDKGVDFELIYKELPLIQADYLNDFENEIYVTSCALALWETGLMTPEKLFYIKSIVDKGACVKKWAENNKEQGKARQNELNKFLKKISKTNTKVRPRKNYRKISNLYFQPDDTLTFQLKDGNYRAVICAKIEQYRGKCNYILVPTTFNSDIKPTFNNLEDMEILGRTIGSGYSQDTTREMQRGIERIWNLLGGNCNFFFGLVQLAVDHKDFIGFKDKFEKFGTLKIVEGLKETGSFGYESNFEGFETIFGDLERHIRVFEYKKYPVKALCDL